MTKRTAVESLSLLLSLAGYLSKRRTATVEDLAAHFGVSESEIISTAKTLGFSGVGSYGWGEVIDLNFDLLEDGVVDIKDTQAIEDVPKLSSAEAAIFISGLNYLQSLPEFKTDDDIPKLISLLQEGSAAPQNKLFEIRPGTPEFHFNQIRQAISSQVRIRCTYINLKGEKSERYLDPLRLESRDQVWYLQAYCLRDGYVKFFRVEQLRILELTEEPISDDARKARLDDEIYKPNEYDVSVVVELEPEARSIASEFGNGDPFVELDNGRVRATLNIGYLPYLGKLIAEFGGAAVVIGPPEARAVVRDYALQSLGSKGVDDIPLIED